MAGTYVQLKTLVTGQCRMCHHSSVATSEIIDVEARVAAVEVWIAAAKQAFVIGSLPWDNAWSDIRRLAVNHILRRQIEALDATVVLAKAGLGHLAVGFVRPALDELLWMLWVKDLPQPDAQNLLLAMGRSDGIRSLLAQRAHVGDAVMQELWYPVALLDAQEQQQSRVNDELAKIRKQFSWKGHPLPSASWVAKQTGHSDLYEYLHAAASRSLHFSMGEVMRNSWGDPDGEVVTLKAEFRDYRTYFALYQLPLLFGETVSACHEFFEHAGITEENEVIENQLLAASKALGKFGRVPLVHAYEWNLTPSGPLKTPMAGA